MRALGAVAALALALPPGAPMIVRIAETEYDVDEAVVFDNHRALPSLLADFRELDVDWPSLGFDGCASADCAAAGLLAELRRRRVTIADDARGLIVKIAAVGEILVPRDARGSPPTEGDVSTALRAWGVDGARDVAAAAAAAAAARPPTTADAALPPWPVDRAAAGEDRPMPGCISSVLRRTVGDKMPGVEYVACGRYCLATGTRFLRFTVEAGAPAASVAAADQMERGGAGVDPPGSKPLETTSTPVV